MPTIYAATTDRDINSGIQSSWSGARDASTGTLGGSASDSSEGFAAGALAFSGRGSTTYKVNRSFFHFDTSGITGTVSSATLKIYFLTDVNDGNVIIIKSDAFTGGSNALVADDFNNLDFSTPYSGEVDTTTAGLTNITLNATALTDIKNNNDFKFAVVNFDYDYGGGSGTAPSTSNYVGLRFADYSGTSSDPQIDYTLQTGYANNVIGISSANIGKVNGVATANIEKVIGV
tara:strand:+ start:1896 stop:2591 length:696 start_codon:yes stop_codon:yes gene_type:complete